MSLIIDHHHIYLQNKLHFAHPKVKCNLQTVKMKHSGIALWYCRLFEVYSYLKILASSRKVYKELTLEKITISLTYVMCNYRVIFHYRSKRNVWILTFFQFTCQLIHSNFVFLFTNHAFKFCSIIYLFENTL